MRKRMQRLNARSWVLRAGAAAVAVGVGVVGGLLLSGGGGASQVVTTTVTTEPRADEVIEEPITDDATAEEGEDFSFSQGSDERDCDELGINADGLREGSCVDGGQTVRVVNRESILRLPELNVRLLSVDVTESLNGSFGDTATARGRFVVLRLEVRNKLRNPVDFDIEQVGLTLDGNEYSSDFDSTQVLNDNLIYETIQPQATLVGTVVFDVPRRMVEELDRSGNVLIVQFSDAQSYEGLPEPLGVIRTYN